MKKALPILAAAILLCTLILASCNQDATIGIYSEVSQSMPSANVTMVRYLGDNGDGTYYYLADDGVFSYKSGTSKALFKSDASQRVVDAYLESSTSLYVLREKNSDKTTSLTRYSGSDLSTATDLGSGFKRILDGFCWKTEDSVSTIYYIDDGLHQYDNSVFDDCDSFEVIYSLQTESNDSNYAFFCLKLKKGSDETYHYYILKKGNGVPLAKVISKKGDPTYEGKRYDSYCGFQYIGNDSTFMLFHKESTTNVSSALKFTDDSITSFVSSMNNSLKKAYTQSASFYNELDDTVIVSCTNYFEIIHADGTKESKNKEYATNISTADITNFKLKSGSSTVFIVGTVENLLYSIDMSNPSATPVKL